MMSHRILPATLLLCILAAACGENPAGVTAAQPAGPAYDGGGFTMGSGGIGAQTSADEVETETLGADGSTSGSGGRGTASPTENTTASVDGGGFTMGSGG